MKQADAILLAMSNPRPGRAADLAAWYVKQHLPDVCAVPGVLRGEFTVASGGAEGLRWVNASSYWLNGNPAEILDEILRRINAGEWTMSDTIDRASSVLMIGEALTPRMRSTAMADAQGMDRQLFIVLTNATPGDDDAFNTWYNEVHLADVLAVPGFVAAQRFRLLDYPALPQPPYRYLAIYEVLARSADAAFAELSARAGTDSMVLSPTLDTGDVHAVAFSPAGIAVAAD